MDSKYLTTRVWEKTLQKLRFIRAYTGETIVAIIDRLATAELEKLKREKSHNSPETE